MIPPPIDHGSTLKTGVTLGADLPSSQHLWQEVRMAACGCAVTPPQSSVEGCLGCPPWQTAVLSTLARPSLPSVGISLGRILEGDWRALREGL